MLTQKKDIKKQKEKLEAMKKEAEEERLRAKAAARERVLEDFEKGQLGLSGRPSVTTGMAATESQQDGRGTKRKFTFDPSTVENLAQEAEEAALHQIEREQAEALKHKLPDFWLPSLTPTYTSKGTPTSLTDVKLQTTCRGGNPSHSLALKNLVPVQFTLYTSNGPAASSANSTPVEGSSSTAKEEPHKMCPSCKKQLSNNTIIFCMFLLVFVANIDMLMFRPVMKPCAHVTCKTCTDTLVRPAKQCIVCDKELAEKDVIELRREGILEPTFRGFALTSLLQEPDLLEEDWQRPRRLV
ncbi:hypothetical protein VNI00_006893 [Paramarasmius palmivorus]|uniref:RING-type domain-containing protein n=1 Tax=Paramarasmius palmivorus TaxID=297713 RepID=A0AAW0DAN5_9AGAR